MLADAPDLDQIVVPIGGGGLISGIAVAVEALKPAVAVMGVEAALFPSFHNALTATTAQSAGRRWRKASPSRPSER